MVTSVGKAGRASWHQRDFFCQRRKVNGQYFAKLECLGLSFSAAELLPRFKETHVERPAQLHGASVQRNGGNEPTGESETQEPRCCPQNSRGAAKVPYRRKAHQGRNRALQ